VGIWSVIWCLYLVLSKFVPWAILQMIIACFQVVADLQVSIYVSLKTDFRNVVQLIFANLHFGE